jgi:hypothetical protein
VGLALLVGWNTRPRPGVLALFRRVAPALFHADLGGNTQAIHIW